MQSNNFNKDLGDDLDKISNKLLQLDTQIINDNLDEDILHKNLYMLRKQFLKIELEFSKYALNNGGANGANGGVDNDKIKRQIEMIRKNLSFIENYHKAHLQLKQKNTISSLTIITLIFLPLTLVTGYFGMNFKAMGSPTMKQGIFSSDKGQHIVMFLFMISIVFILVLVQSGIIHK